jgi:hypothetical protein
MTTNRRDFLRSLGSRVVREAREISEIAGPSLRAMSEFGNVLGDDPATEDFIPLDFAEPPPSRTDARAPERCLEIEEFCELARAQQLEARLPEIQRLARRSVRMTSDAPHPGEAEAWLDLDAGLEIAHAAPVDGGPEFVPVAQIALSALALRETSLAGSGWLVVSVERTPSQSPDVAEALRATVQRHEQPSAFAPTMQPMRLGAQLQLPRVWSDPVQALELDPDEHYAYIRLRDQVSERQGVEVERDGGAELAYHRLLGWPDETTEAMPDDCAAAAGAGDWRLLVQMSVGAAERVYVWAAADDYQRAVAFIR